jgi:HK97 gp10 family phage protein
MASAEVVFNHFGPMADALAQATKQVVVKTAFDLQAAAVIQAPIDTGFLRASIYTVTSTSSSYGTTGKVAHFNAYKALHQDLLPEIDEPSDDYTAYVAVGATYGVYVNYGTRYMAAQPFWEPAIDMVRPSFNAAMDAIRQKMESAT